MTRDKRRNLAAAAGDPRLMLIEGDIRDDSALAIAFAKGRPAQRDRHDPVDDRLVVGAGTASVVQVVIRVAGQCVAPLGGGPFAWVKTPDQILAEAMPKAISASVH